MLICGKHGALLVSATGKLGDKHGARINFSIVSGVVIIHVGESFKVVIHLPRKAAFPFVADACRALTAAGHTIPPAHARCVIDPV